MHGAPVERAGAQTYRGKSALQRGGITSCNLSDEFCIKPSFLSHTRGKEALKRVSIYQFGTSSGLGFDLALEGNVTAH